MAGLPEPEFTPARNPGGSPQVIGKLYASTGFGSMLFGLVPLDWPVPEVNWVDANQEPEYATPQLSPNPVMSARMQVRVFRRADTREFGLVTAEWWHRTFWKDTRYEARGLNQVDMTIPVLWVWYEEVGS